MRKLEVPMGKGAVAMFYWNNWLWLVIGSFLALILVLAMATSARSHDHNRPELAPWYKSLQSKKGPCCDGSDAQSLDDPEWRVVSSDKYEVFLEGHWVVVPETALVEGPNRDGRALVWPMRGSYGRMEVRCFLPGSMT